MTADEFRNLALQLPGALEDSHMGHPDFRIGNRIFAALLPREIEPWFFVALPVIIFAIETGRYAIVVLALSAQAPRSAYLRYKSALDRIAGSVMALLGVRLIAGVE